MKRFTDTDLWQKPWFMQLTPLEKMAWYFVKDHCDSVGVWTPNYPLAEFMIGSQLDWEKFRDKCNGNIEVLDNGKWWLMDFCFFQYGVLTSSCKPHTKYISELKKHGLFERVSKGYTKGINTQQEKEEEEEQEKEQDKKRKYGEFVFLTDGEFGKLVERYGESRTRLMITKLDNYKGSSGKKYKSDYRAILSWVVEKVEPLATPGTSKDLGV